MCLCGQSQRHLPRTSTRVGAAGSSRRTHGVTLRPCGAAPRTGDHRRGGCLTTHGRARGCAGRLCAPVAPAGRAVATACSRAASYMRRRPSVRSPPPAHHLPSMPDPLAQLPYEIGLDILAHLDDVDALVRVRRVSRHWCARADDEHLWHVLARRHILASGAHPPPSGLPPCASVSRAHARAPLPPSADSRQHRLATSSWRHYVQLHDLVARQTGYALCGRPISAAPLPVHRFRLPRTPHCIRSVGELLLFSFVTGGVQLQDRTGRVLWETSTPPCCSLEYSAAPDAASAGCGRGRGRGWLSIVHPPSVGPDGKCSVHVPPRTLQALAGLLPTDERWRAECLGMTY